MASTIIRNNLYNLSSRTDECDILWVDVSNKFKRNFLEDIIYRHPDSNLDIFLVKL